MPNPPPIDYGSLPFDAQIKFFRAKKTIATRAWTDLWQSEHDHAFVVAGAMKADLLADLRAAVDSAISEGTTLASFRKDFDALVARRGWAYKGARGWRTRVIYETNLRTSYQAGRFAQMRAVTATRPFWRYRHNDSVSHPRPIHASWDGITLAHDDPWWETHYTPNGWGCKCTIETLSKRGLKAAGKSGPDTAPPLKMRTVTVGKTGPSPRTVTVPEGIDPGWAFAPGRSAWIDAVTPPALPALLPSASSLVRADALPPARAAPASRLLPAGLGEAEAIRRFLAEFGLKAGERATLFEDVAGEFLLISDALFRELGGRLKVSKRGRARFLLLLADTIKRPDEIWQDMARFGDRAVMRRRYVARWSVAGSDIPAVVVFETGPQGWVGVTAHKPDNVADLERRSRAGSRVWKRK